jgi:hypothetical protein
MSIVILLGKIVLGGETLVPWWLSIVFFLIIINLFIAVIVGMIYAVRN